MSTGTKQCVGCMDYKPRTEFYISGKSEDGLNRYCMYCCKVNRSLEGVRKRDRRSKISFRQRYRAKQLGLACDDDITLAKVYRRARGICQGSYGCGKWVQPKHASIDHVMPMSKGGPHVWSNVQLMHLKCNLRKSYKEGD